MTDYHDLVNKQYGQTEIGERILEAFKREGMDIDALTLDDLSPIDQLHAGGREATGVLATMAGIEPGMNVLDVGSGVGGPARTLAADFGCRVTGIDLTQGYVEAAQLLTEKVGLSSQVNFRVGNALDLEFEDGAFDAVWTQNAIMNIENKERVFQEIHRVLRPNGVLAMEAIMAGTTEESRFPVFWADNSGVSFVSPSGDFRQMMSEVGFEEHIWNDVTPYSVERGRNGRAASGDAPPALGLHIFYADVPRKAENTLRGWEDGTYVDVCAVFRRKVERNNHS